MWIPQGIYADFLLRQPTIFFGKGSVRGLFNFPGHKIAVIHGKGMNDSIFEQLQGTFKKRSLRFIRKSWGGEPDMEGLKGTLAELEEFRPDVIIAVGGGSVIDGGKLCRLFYEFPYINIEKDRMGQLEFKTRFLAIPTTVGSGAEASSAAVYYRPEEKRKKMVVCHGMQPEAVILDPDATAGISTARLYESIFDALGHLIEGFVSVRRNVLAKQMAVQAVAMICDVLKKENLTAGEDILNLQYAGYLGGMVQNHCLVGSAHAIAHQMTYCGYSHGKAVALLLAQSIRMNRRDEAAKIRYDFLSAFAGLEDSDGLLSFLDRLGGRMETDRERAAEYLKSCKKNEAFYTNVREDLGGKGNPVPITNDYITQFIEELALWNI